MTPVPDFLTIEEAARVLRIGRTKAYAMGQEWRTTNGASGMKVSEVGGQLRVPRAWLEEQLGAPVLLIPAAPQRSKSNGYDREPGPEALPTAPPSTATRTPAPLNESTRPRRRRKRTPVNSNQLSLPFTA